MKWHFLLLKGQQKLTIFSDLVEEGISYLQLFLELPGIVWSLQNRSYIKKHHFWCNMSGFVKPNLTFGLIYIVKTRGSNTHLLLQIHFGNYCKMTRCDWNDINFQELKTSQILHPPKVVAATLHKSKRRGTRPCVPELSHFPCSNVPIYIIYTEKPGSCTFLHCLSSFGELQSRQLAQPGKTEIPSNIWRYLKFIFLWKVFESRSDIDKIGKALAPSCLSREPSGGSENSVCLKDFLIACDLTTYTSFNSRKSFSLLW